MSLTNGERLVTKQDLSNFYHKVLPYMGGSSGGSGHAIEDSEGTELEQRDTLQFGEGFKAEDDDTNEKTVISPDVMQSGDMSDVITPLPSVAPKKEGVVYSTTEQVIGEWIDGKPVYEKIVDFGDLPNNTTKRVAHGITNFGTLISISGVVKFGTAYYHLPIMSSGSDLVQQIGCDDTDVFIKVLTNWSSWTNCYLTIRYTKTTD